VSVRSPSITTTSTSSFFPWLLLAVPVLAAWEFPNLPLLANVAGTSVYPEDLIAGYLLVSGMSSLRLVNRALASKAGLFLLLIAVAAFSLARGLQRFPLGEAINEARAPIYIIAVSIWILSRAQRPGFHTDLSKYLSLLGWGLTVVFIFHAGRYGLGASDSFVQVTSIGTEAQTGRPLVSGQALALSLAALYRLALGGRGANAGWLWLVIVLVAQHRSVWVAVIAAMIVLFFYATGPVRARLTMAAMAGAVVVIVGSVAGAFDSIFAELARAATDDRTLTGRTFAWAELVSQHNALGWFVRLLGQPFGTGYYRVNVRGVVELFQPHNWFVVMYLRIGAVGLLAMLAILARAFMRNIRARRVVQLVWLTAVVVYCLAYPLAWYLAPFLAVCLVAAGDPIRASGDADEDVVPIAVQKSRR
jgi:hypothetical protein